MIIPNIITVHAQQSENDNELLLEIKELRKEIADKTVLLIQTFFTILVIPASVLIALWIYKHGEKNQKNENKKRSSLTIKKEILEIRDGIIGNKHTRKKAPTSKEYLFGENENQKHIDEINYVNAYFVVDAYKSTLHSGIFTYFETHTQHKITELYARISSHNETAIYIKKYADNYFLDVNAEIEDWQIAVERYEVILSLLEIEILELIDEVLEIEEIKKIVEKHDS